MNNPNAYCLDLQRTSKNQACRIKRKEKGLAQPHYSIQHIEGYDLVCYKERKQDLHFSIIETINKEYCPGTMNIYFIRERLEQKTEKTIRNTMTLPGLTQFVEH
jgi:hypothetical protein